MSVRPGSSPRLRILLSASVASPFRGSEPGVSWNAAVHLARHCEVTLLTGTGPKGLFRREIESYVAEHGSIPGLQIAFVEHPPLSRWLQHGRLRALLPLYYVGYASWQRAALRAARALHDEGRFDLAH